MKKFLYLLATPIALSGFCHGFSYTQNFNTLTNGANLAGQDGWLISGGAGNSTSGVSLVTSSFLSGGGRAGVLGYQDLSTGDNQVYLYQQYGQSLVGNEGGYTEFLADIAIFDSVTGIEPSYANRDTFGITFRNGGTNILTIAFTPTTFPTEPDLPAENRVDQLSWFGYGGSSGGAFGSMTEGGAGNPTALSILFSPSGSDVSFAVKSSGTTITTGLLPGAAGQDLTTFGFTMNTLSGTESVGTNQFVFDNITVVPEPSSALLGLLGASFALGRRRRA